MLQLLVATACCLCACAPLRISRPVFKVGLLAPFEGKGRATGYEALYAAKLALQERNASGGVAGWSVELVALDNSNQVARSIEQTRVLVVDPDVMRMLIVVPAADVFAARSQLAPFGMPFDVVAGDGGKNSAPPSPAFVDAYRGISGGITPGGLAVQTYSAYRQLLSLSEGQIRVAGQPSR